jgi:hypothetical protein
MRKYFLWRDNERGLEYIRTEFRDIQKGGLIAMISSDNGDNLLQRQIRYNGKIIGNERGRCNEGWLYMILYNTNSNLEPVPLTQ